jgi:hypothetical protein
VLARDLQFGVVEEPLALAGMEQPTRVGLLPDLGDELPQDLPQDGALSDQNAPQHIHHVLHAFTSIVMIEVIEVFRRPFRLTLADNLEAIKLFCQSCNAKS